MFHPEVIYVLYRRVDIQTWEGMWFEVVDILELFDVITIHVHISHHMDEFSSLEASDLSNQTCQ